MKKNYLLILFLGLFSWSHAQVTVQVDATASWVGYANVFETPANGGGFVFGGFWGIPDLKTVIDGPGQAITLQPNFNTWNPADPFWVTPSGEANKWFEGNTYVEDNSLVGSAFTFEGGCTDFTIDPGYTVIAFIKVFNANFSVLKQEDVTLTAGENFSVTYTNVEATDAFVQYGFQVFGPVADPANEVALGNVVVTPLILNDDCQNADPIACGDTLTGDTSVLTDQGGFNDAPDAWFEFVGNGSTEIVTASLCDGGTTYDSRISVFDACGGAVIASNDDSCGLQSEVSFLSDGTSSYFIAVEGFSTNSAGPFSLSVSCTEVAANDDCADALPIDCGAPVFGSTENATPENLADCGTTITAPGVWYVYEDTTGLVTDITVDTCGGGTDYDTKLSVFTGECGDLVCLDGNDDDCGLQSSVSFQSDGNTTYYILVHGFGGGTGNFELSMTCTVVPPPNDLIANSIDVDEAGIPYTDPSVVTPAATFENGNPDGCNIDGANGVWYNFTAAGSGTATAQIVSPAGSSYVVFFKAPDENATETDLEYFFQVGNQCAPATEANITTEAGQTYYVFVVNTGGLTDIVIDGELLSTADNLIEGFEFYPNPANERINLNAVENIDRVAIYNLLGQEVISREVGDTNAQLNVSALQTGAYLMKVTVNGQVGTYKVIKR